MPLKQRNQINIGICLYVPTTGRVQYKAFFKVGPNAEP